MSVHLKHKNDCLNRSCDSYFDEDYDDYDDCDCSKDNCQGNLQRKMTTKKKNDDYDDDDDEKIGSDGNYFFFSYHCDDTFDVWFYYDVNVGYPHYFDSW